MNGHTPNANRLTDELSDITTLLQELPRVSAPANFNDTLKARIAAAQAEVHEFADITALVKELPHIAAPANFNEMVMARIAAAQVEASEHREFANITSLIQELPHVAAPADFDFKLRARIARAKSEDQKSATGLFAELFGRSFSWLQASAAMVAVAIVVSVVTFGVLRSDDGVSTPSNPVNIAVISEKTETNKPVPQSFVMPSAPQPTTVRTQRNYTPTPINVAATSRQYSLRNKYSAPIPEPKTPVVPENNSTAVASKVMIKHQSGQSRMVNLSEYNLGLQTAHLRQEKVRPNSGNEPALANIF